MRGMPGMPQLTQEQQAALRAMNQATAPLDQAITEARNALNAAIYSDKPDPADIKATVDELAAAELARSLARADAFAKLQASPNRLNLPSQQLISLMNMRGRRGGFGGPGFGPDGPGGFGGPGGPGGGLSGFGGPGGAGRIGGNQPPPIKDGFEWID